MHRKVAAALVAALALGVASCGSSDEPLTRAELVRQVEAACAQGQRQAEAAQRESRSSVTGDAFLTSLIAGQRTVSARIADIDPPDELSDDFDAFKQNIEARTAVFERFQASRAKLTDKRAIAAIEPEVQALGERLQAVTRRLGIEGCA